MFWLAPLRRAGTVGRVTVPQPLSVFGEYIYFVSENRLCRCGLGFSNRIIVIFVRKRGARKTWNCEY